MHSWMHHHTACIYSMHASNNTCSNQWSQAAALCTQAEHRGLDNTMSTCTIWACARVNTSSASCVKAVALLSFDALVLEILQGSPSILWYRWTFQGERQFVVGILSFIGVSVADNGSQGYKIMP